MAELPVNIYSRFLGATELPLNFYSINSGGGSQAYTDSSGRHSVINLYGNATVTYDAPVFGNGCGKIDGDGDFFSVEDNLNDFVFADSDFTVEFWGLTHTPNGSWGGSMYGKRTDGQTQASVLIAQDNAGHFAWSASSDNLTWDIFYSKNIGSFVLGQWHHIVGGRSGTTWYSFLDGISGQGITNSAILSDNGSIVRIGGNATNEYFNGKIDELRVSNISRYTPGVNFTPPTSPFTVDSNTMLLLHFDDISSSEEKPINFYSRNI